MRTILAFLPQVQVRSDGNRETDLATRHESRRSERPWRQRASHPLKMVEQQTRAYNLSLQQKGMGLNAAT